VRRLLLFLTAASWVISPALSPPRAESQSGRPAAPSLPSPSYRAVLDQYCVTCHNSRLKTANLTLDTLDLANLPNDADVWEKILRKLRTGAMPPVGARQLDTASYEVLVGQLESELDRWAAAHPDPGRPLLHRLNRVEYGNAIRDLLDLDIGDVAALLPPDDSAYGFDNVADVLGVSPLLLERYLNAAGTISSLAVGDLETTPGTDTYHVRQDLSQDRHLEGLPFGTVGGLLVHHTFPLDGDYTFQVKLFRTNVDAIRGLESPHQLEITVDGARVHLTRIGGPDDLRALFPNVLPNGAGDVNRAPSAGDEIEKRLRVRIPVKAGPRVVGVAFLGQSPVVDTTQLQPFLRSSHDTYNWSGLPHIESLAIAGPFDAVGPSDTPSRRRIFVCRPTNRADEEACATKVIRTLARRAYRQPVTDTDLRRLMTFYEAGRRSGTFDSGIQAALERILASPKFVFRAEGDRAGASAGTVYRLNDFELASRLSFFLWSSIPDDALLNVASRGTLSNPTVLASQVRRMLGDRKANALVSNFGNQWLQVRNLRSIVPDNDEFPDFDDNLRQAFQRETELFFESVIREDRSVIDLLTADYTFVNERLAKHYAIPNIYGSHFRRVTLTDDARKGLLGKGAILMVTSHANKTSPVKRGKWVLENLLGAPPPPPLPEVPALKERTDDGKLLTMREQMEEHRRNAVCASCHKLMDPFGFALEHFDAVGAWRTRDAGLPIDASSQLFDGTSVNGAIELRQALIKRSNVFVDTLTEKLLTYALGRGVDSRDLPVVRAIVRESAKSNYRFSSLVLGIVSSSPFQMSIKKPLENDKPPARTAAR
jgi:mono/diheme cytochrome c family protein